MSARWVSAFRLALALGTFTGPALAGSPISLSAGESRSVRSDALASASNRQTSSGTPSRGVVAVGSAASTVHVILGDPTSTPPLAAMKLIAKPNPVVSGRVTFAVTNTSKTLQHELLVVRVPGDQERLPYNKISRKVVESQIDKIGDSGDLRARTSTTFTVRLKSGKYLLICNQPGHYRAGMWDWLTVRRSTVRPVGLGR